MSTATEISHSRKLLPNPRLVSIRQRIAAPNISTLNSFLYFTIVTSIWLLSRCYGGIVHDSRIYIGRAVADLDPNGLGRDVLFVMDGQTKLSMYSKLIEPAVRIAGPSFTAMSLSLVSLLLWLGAAAWLASRLAPRRYLAAALICAAVMPACYGPFNIFTFGEALATPRGIAEVGVIAALAALIDGRRLLCAGLLTGGALFHPAMAAPGIGVAFLVLALEDVRWWVMVPLAATGLFGSALLHLGPAKTLLTPMDPDWRRIMEVRNSFLFVRLWPLDAWSDAVLSVTTVVIAALLQPRGRIQTVLLCTAGIVVGGVAIAFLFGDMMSSTLVLQLQPWRTLWLAKVVAVLMLPFCAERLWTSKRGDARLALVLLAFGWCTLRGAGPAAPVALSALGLCALPFFGAPDKVTPRVLALGALGIATLTGLLLARQVFWLTTVVRAVLRAGAIPRLSTLLIVDIHTIPIVLATMVMTIRERRPSNAWRAIAPSMLAATLVPLTMMSWDQRKPTRRVVDSSQSSASLNRLIGPDRRGVVWLADDVAPWFLLSRATWVNNLQGTVGAFSRPLAMTWNTRVTALINSGLGNQLDRNPWDANPNLPFRSPAAVRDGAIRLCETQDGPDAIVAVGDLSQRFAPGVAAVWTSPVKDLAVDLSSKRLTFSLFDKYTVIRCDRAAAAYDVQRPLTAGA